MLDTEMTTLLRAVLDEVCVNVPESEIAMRQRVAAKIFEATQKGLWSIDDVRRAGREALTSTPTMWP